MSTTTSPDDNETFVATIPANLYPLVQLLDKSPELVNFLRRLDSLPNNGRTLVTLDKFKGELTNVTVLPLGKVELLQK